jgi:hypothetical protein
LKDESLLGSYWYAGAPGSGKTTRALADAADLCARSGFPIVALDTVHARQLARLPEAGTIRDLCRLVWREGKHARFFPNDDTEADRFFAASWGGRRVHVIVDEVHHFANSYRIAPNLSLLLRSYRHAEVSLHLTTQSFADVPQAALAQAPHLRIFRNTAPRALERLEAYTGIDAERIRALPQFQFLDWSDGFSA